MVSNKGFSLPLWAVLLGCLCVPCAPLVRLSTERGESRGRKKAASDSSKSPQRRKELSIAPQPARRISSARCILDLPLEIRQLIYQFVLGGNTFHISDVPMETRIAYWYGEYSHLIPYHTHLFGITPSDKKSHINGMLNLLRTCHQIYSEAVESLYRENTFAFYGDARLILFLKFTNKIPTQRLGDISSLHFDVQADSFEPRKAAHIWHTQGEAGWIQQWDIITNKMIRLRRVEIKLERMFEADLRLSIDQSWLKPVLRLSNLDAFLLDLQRVHIKNDSGRQFPASFSEEAANLQQTLREKVCKQSICRSTEHPNILVATVDPLFVSQEFGIRCGCEIKAHKPTM